MDIGAIISLLAAIVFIVVSILLGGVLSAFYDLPSVMITIGGSVAASLVAYPLPTAIAAVKGLGIAFSSKKIDFQQMIQSMVDMSVTARKEGLLSLEEMSESIENDFIKKGILLIVDGADPDMIRNVLETDNASMLGRHSKVYGYWEKLGELAPAWGMIGTLIGLINMLRNLEDASTIGPAMAVALITTFYGSLIANLFALPIASKMKIKSQEEAMANEMIIEGVLAIQAGENPKVLDDKMKSFLAPNLRIWEKEERGDS